jgi:rhodanese-related sulfurtransferase
MANLNQITPAQLMRRIGTPDAPLILDVTTDEDFALDPRLIPGARRVAHHALAADPAQYQGQEIVVICQKGLKLSQGAAALMRMQGSAAEYLAGGNHGWKDAGLPLVPASALPGIETGGTLWVTRHRPKIDRIACPWLVRRFVDRGARFLFVEPAQVEQVAERYGATPFDVEGVFWSHHGERCTFDTMLDAFALRTDPLDRLAQVVRAADTNRHDLAPQAAGLLAVSVGFSRMYRDDNQQLEAALPLYDALYRWARDGFDEGHDWPTGQGR